MLADMNKLDGYLTDREMTNAAFGRLVGASESTISRIRHGKQAPSFSLARRIKDATAGEVTADDLMATAPTLSPADAPHHDNQATDFTTDGVAP